MAFEERVLLEEFDNAEGGAAGREDVHAAVLITFGNVQNFGGAPDPGETFGKRKEHAELGFFFKTVFHHFAVTGLEYVQGKLHARKKDDVQRKQRNAFRPHGSQEA
jgi:hypothetical protein